MRSDADAAGPAAALNHLPVIHEDLWRLTVALLILAAVALLAGILFRRRWPGKLALAIAALALIGLGFSGWLLWSTGRAMGAA